MWGLPCGPPLGPLRFHPQVQGLAACRHVPGVSGFGLETSVGRKPWTSRGLGARYSRVCLIPAERRAPVADDVLVRLRARLLGYARRVGREDAAEDLVQETFVVLTTKYAHVRAPEECVPLGIAILKKKMAAHHRKVRRRGEDSVVDASDAKLPAGEPDPEEAAHRRMLQERLQRAISGLSGRCRELVRLKLEDRTFAEIAEILEAKLNTVYSWDRRCTERLRAVLLETEVRR